MSKAPIAAAGGESQSEGSPAESPRPEGHVVDDISLCMLVTRSLTRIKEDLKSTNAPILEMAASREPDPKAINQLFSKSMNKYAEIAVSAAESLEQIRQFLIERMLANVRLSKD